MTGGRGNTQVRPGRFIWRGPILFLLLSFSALWPWLIGSPGWLVPGKYLVLAALCISVLRSWWLAGVCLVVSWMTLVAIQGRIDERLPAGYIGETLELTGTVENLPNRREGMLEFVFRVSRVQQAKLNMPPRIRVRWYTMDYVALTAGQVWRLPLRLKAPLGRLNFSGQDPEQRYFAQRIGALGTVAKGKPYKLQDASAFSVPAWRENLRQRLSDVLSDEPALAQVLALAIADRDRMSQEQWRVFSRTGTGHLLAISGLHIGFAGLLGYRFSWLVLLALGARTRTRLGTIPNWAGAIFLALVYAALAGFAVSTQRALAMLAVLGFAALSRRDPGPWLAWALSLFVVLLIDPSAPLQAGFWLSFGAVLILISVLSPRVNDLGPVRARFMAQVAIGLAMLPLGIFWFQQATGVGLVANLFAIPAVSVAIVPLVLVGTSALALGLDSWAEKLLLPAAWAADGLFRALAGLLDLADSLHFETGAIPIGSAVLATAGLLLVMVPAGRSGRSPGLMLAVAALSLGFARPRPGELKVDLLDVGQGLATLVTTQESLLLYDSGPGQPGEWDLVAPVILPAIRTTGFSAPTHIVIGHGDLDHAGGLETLRAHYSSTPLWVNSRHGAAGSNPCDVRLAWTDATAAFRVLHPSGYLPYLGNLSSCVFSIRSRDLALLLPGDIDRVIEHRLIADGLLPHEILIAPHHGSRTSSSERFLNTLQPSWALIPAGVANRFGFPHAEVTRRYRRLGIATGSISDCGALRMRVLPGGDFLIRSARRQRSTLWRWQPATACP